MGTCVDLLTEIRDWIVSKLDVPASDLNQEATQTAISGKLDTMDTVLDDLLDNIKLHNDIVDSEKSVAWTGGQAANTLKSVSTIAFPTGRLDRIYSLFVQNPSVDTDITVCVYAKQTQNGTARYHTLADPYTIPKSPDNNNPDTSNKVSGKVKLIHGAMVGEGIAITIYNNSTATNAFTSYITLRVAD